MKERPNEAATNANFEFEALRHARNYRAALVREFSPQLRGDVLEIGAGVGQVTELIRALPGVRSLQAIEPDAGFCREFRRALPGQPLIEGTIAGLPVGAGWDAILSVNVLEHIRDDEGELQNYYALLRARQGTLNLFVPARPEIYAPIDRDFGHHRRYTRDELQGKMERAGFAIERLRYFNFAGYFAWWVKFRLLGRRRFHAGSVRLFDRLIFPAIHAFESRVLAPPIGQSLLAVGRAR